MSRRVVAIVVAALLLAVGMGGLGILTARALRERDRAVRDGLLVGAAQDLENALRQDGPDGADAAIQTFLARHDDVVAGVELSTGTGLVAKGGVLTGEPAEHSVALGPAWRRVAGGGLEPGRGRGRGAPPFTFRLYPTSAIGGHEAMATAVVTLSTATAAALFILALLAARGLIDRERRMQAEAEQRRLQIAATTGAALAHRIRTPLATIKGTAQLLESQQMFSAERARRIVDESVRIDQMIRRLLDFAHPPEPQGETFDAAHVARLVAGRAEGTNVSAPETLSVFADPIHYETVLEELVANARAFDGGAIDIRLTASPGEVVTEVRDHGPGLSIDPAQATEPYVTTRAAGTGLGLAIAQTLIRANRGTLQLRNAQDGGCIATIRLPESR